MTKAGQRNNVRGADPLRDDAKGIGEKMKIPNSLMRNPERIPVMMILNDGGSEAEKSGGTF